jgi:hypothetical protein
MTLSQWYMKVKSVMLKLENDLDSLYKRQVSFSCIYLRFDYISVIIRIKQFSVVCLFIWHRNANLESKIVLFISLWTSEIRYNIKVCLLNVKDTKNITAKIFSYLFTKYNQNG